MLAGTAHAEGGGVGEFSGTGKQVEIKAAEIVVAVGIEYVVAPHVRVPEWGAVVGLKAQAVELG